MSEKIKEGEQWVTSSVRFELGLREALEELAAKSGLRMSDLVRLALKNLLASVRETGELPIAKIEMGEVKDA